MKSVFCKCARGFISNDVEEFKDTLRIVKPILTVRSARDFREFVAGDGAEAMHERLMDSLVGLNRVQRASFSLRAEALLDHIRSVHDEHYYERQQSAVSRRRKELSSYDWDALKQGLRGSLKEASANISLLYGAILEQDAPCMLPKHVVGY